MYRYKSKTIIKQAVGAVALCVSMLLAGCQPSTRQRVVDKFPTEKALTASPVPALDSMYRAYGISTVGNKYVVVCKRAERFFYVFDSSYRQVAQFATPGNGHDEWLAPMATGQYTERNDTVMIYVLERPTNQLYLQPLANDAKRQRVANLSIKGVGQLRTVFLKGANDYVGVEDDAQCLPITLKDGKKTALEHPVPDVDKLGARSNMLLQTLSTMQRAGQKWASCYFSYPMVVIRNMDGSLVSTLKIGNQWPRYTSDAQKEPFFYCVDMCSSEQAVYVLYNMPGHDNESYVLAFSWDGDPLARYRIRRSVAFTVNEAARKIVAINDDDSDGMFSEYKY